MKKTCLLFLLTSALSLMSCTSASQPHRQPVAGGERISFPSQHISFFLPDGWKVMPKTRGPGRLLGAARGNDGRPGGMVFALIAAPETSTLSVRDPAFLKSFQQSWKAKGFTKQGKPQRVIVGGHEAMRCELHKPNAEPALLNYTFIEGGRMIGLLFSYYSMPVEKGPAVQRIVDSFTISP